MLEYELLLVRKSNEIRQCLRSTIFRVIDLPSVDVFQE
jgi:hypothetical protein